MPRHCWSYRRRDPRTATRSISITRRYENHSGKRFPPALIDSVESLRALKGNIMAIIGIESAVYCVEDIDKSVDFFEDFGLHIYDRNDSHTRFLLPDNSNVFIRFLAPLP